jgi:hypothetical protein
MQFSPRTVYLHLGPNILPNNPLPPPKLKCTEVFFHSSLCIHGGA